MQMRAQQNLDGEINRLVAEMEARSRREYETQKALEEAKKQLEGIDQSRLTTLKHLKEKEVLELKREQDRIARTERAIETELMQLQQRALQMSKQAETGGNKEIDPHKTSVEERRRELAIQQGERLSQLKLERIRLQNERSSLRGSADERPVSPRSVIAQVEKKMREDAAKLEALRAQVQGNDRKSSSQPEFLKPEDWEDAPLDVETAMQTQAPALDVETRRRYEFESAKQDLAEQQQQQQQQQRQKQQQQQQQQEQKQKEAQEEQLQRQHQQMEHGEGGTVQYALSETQADPQRHRSPSPAAVGVTPLIDSRTGGGGGGKSGNDDTLKELRNEIAALKVEAGSGTDPSILAAISALEHEVLRLSQPPKKKGDKPRLSLPSTSRGSLHGGGEEIADQGYKGLSPIDPTMLQHGAIAAGNPLMAQMLAQMSENKRHLQQQQADNERLRQQLENLDRNRAARRDRAGTADPSIRRLIDRVEKVLAPAAPQQQVQRGSAAGDGSGADDHRKYSAANGPLFGEIFEEEMELEELERSMDHESPLYALRKEHLQQMLRLKYEMQRMKQEAALSKLEGELQQLRAEHERENWEQEQQQLLLEAKYRRQLARENVIRAEENSMQNLLQPPPVEYDHEKGFSIFIDWALGVPARVQQCNIVYAFYAGSAPRTEPKLLQLSDCEHEPAATHARCVFAQRRQFSHVPCNPEFRCLMELQSVTTATATAPPRSSAIGWTVIPLFPKEGIALNAGLWRLPCFHPPIRPDQSIEEVKRQARVPRLEIFVRIVRAQNGELHATMPVDIDANAPHYTVAPWLRLDSDPILSQKPSTSPQQQQQPFGLQSTSVKRPPLGQFSQSSFGGRPTPPASVRGPPVDSSFPRNTSFLKSAIQAGNAFAAANNSARRQEIQPADRRGSKDFDPVPLENGAVAIIVSVVAIAGLSLSGRIRVAVSLFSNNGAGIQLLEGLNISDSQPPPSSSADGGAIGGGVAAAGARSSGDTTQRQLLQQQLEIPPASAGTWSTSIVLPGTAGLAKQRVDFPIARRGEFRPIYPPDYNGAVMALFEIQQAKDGPGEVGMDSFTTVAWSCTSIHSHRWSVGNVAVAKLIARLIRRKLQQGRIGLTLTLLRNRASGIIRRHEGANGIRAPLVRSELLSPLFRPGRRQLSLFTPPALRWLQQPSMSVSDMEGASLTVVLLDASSEAAQRRAEGEKRSEQQWRQQAANGVSNVDAGEDEEGTPPFISTPPSPIPRSPFALGDGFDLYIDSARFLPDNAGFSRVYAFVSSSPLTAGSIYGKVEGNCVASSRDIRSPMFRLRKEFRLVSPTDLFDCTSTLVLQLLAFDNIVGCLSVVGFAILNIFVDPLTGKQPVAGTQEFMLNEGAFQLAVHRGGLRSDRVFDASALDDVPIAPATTLLVRILPAPRSSDGMQVLSLSTSRMTDAEAAAAGLNVPPPGYKRGRYASISCTPNPQHQSLYDRLALRPKMRAVDAAMLGNPAMPAEQIQNLTGAAMTDLVASTLATPAGGKGPPPIDARFHTPMVPSVGLAYYVEALTNLPKKSLLPFCMSTLPPFTIYASGGSVTAGSVLHWRLDLSSDQRSPTFITGSQRADGLQGRSIGGTSLNEDGGVVCKDLQWGTDRLTSLVLDIRFLVTHSSGLFKRKLPQPIAEVVGFAVLPIIGSKGPYVLSGRYQTPVFKGLPPREIVEQLISQPCTTVLNAALQQGKIERLQWTSITIRIVDLGTGSAADHANSKPITKLLHDLYISVDEGGPEYESVKVSQQIRKLLPRTTEGEASLIEAATAFAAATRLGAAANASGGGGVSNPTQSRPQPNADDDGDDDDDEDDDEEEEEA